MKDYLYIIENKFMFLSADEEISYRQAWKLIYTDINEKNKLIAKKESVKEKYNCEYSLKNKDKSFTDLENLITI